MSNEIQRADNRLGAILASDQIRDQVLGGLASWMDEKQFTASALAVLSDDKYSKYSAGAKTKCVLQFAVLGLYPGPQNHAYIIPRGPNLDVMPGFRGYVFHARQLPGVHDVTAHLVHDLDDFAVKTSGAGTFEVIKHDFDPLPPKGGREFKPDGTGLRGAYVKMEMKDGDVRYHFITFDTIMLAKSCAQTKNVWNKFPGPMYLKTALRNAQARGFFHGDEVTEARLAKIMEQDDLVSVKPPPALEGPKSAEDFIAGLTSTAPDVATAATLEPEAGAGASEPKGATDALPVEEEDQAALEF